MTLQDENKAVVRAVLLALDSNQLEMLDDHPGYWQTREFMPTLKAAFPDLHHDIQEQIAEGPLVATFSIVTGTNRGAFLGIAASERRVRFQHLDMDRISNGKVVSHNAESGWLSVLIEWGILPLH